MKTIWHHVWQPLADTLFGRPSVSRFLFQRLVLDATFNGVLSSAHLERESVVLSIAVWRNRKQYPVPKHILQRSQSDSTLLLFGQHLQFCRSQVGLPYFSHGTSATSAAREVNRSSTSAPGNRCNIHGPQQNKNVELINIKGCKMYLDCVLLVGVSYLLLSCNNTK